MDEIINSLEKIADILLHINDNLDNMDGRLLIETLETIQRDLRDINLKL